MATEGLTCPECGSSNIVDDQLYSQPQLVCEDCGSVISEGLLTTTASEEVQGTDIAYCYTTAVHNQPCRNLIKGLQRLRAFCRILRLKTDTEKMSETFYKQAYSHPHFINVSLQKKEVLVGCCVLVSCRLCNWPIGMGTICSLLEADPNLLGMVYLQMIKSLKIEAPNTAIIEMLEAHCQEYKLRPEHVSEGLSEDVKALTKRAIALIELAADTWIVTGRQPVPMMIACTFLAWQSLRPTKDRLKYSVDKFCQMAKVNRNQTAPKRVMELKKVLSKLGQEIPWLRVEVTLANVMPHVDDIMENQSALLRRAMRTHEESLQDEDQPDPQECPPGEHATLGSQEGTAPSQTSRDPEHHPPPQPCLAVCEPDREGAQAPSDVDPTTGTDVGQEDDGEALARPLQVPVETWSKKYLFVPPCVRHPKKRKRRVETPMPEVTGDEDISDSEIDMYIRTPQEVRDFVKTKEILSEEGEEDEQ
ncbi:transcription factor IIIB 50 kDa subunit [Hypomesus transpacificus]|uniref:transcription factor IIIB 50 kDa subunit n=1 Tax=Hypomesus transpacificus TaxID=137520 RepID=UPI001F0798AE|nr:transcription factor IIIB 50 kDa subunit [Hypomesus transpacificus]